jgi:hypothetical protein
MGRSSPVADDPPEAPIAIDSSSPDEADDDELLLLLLLLLLVLGWMDARAGRAVRMLLRVLLVRPVRFGSRRGICSTAGSCTFSVGTAELALAARPASDLEAPAMDTPNFARAEEDGLMESADEFGRADVQRRARLLDGREEPDDDSSRSCSRWTTASRS